MDRKISWNKPIPDDKNQGKTSEQNKIGVV